LSALDRILIRLPNWLGDLLLARPLLHAVRRSHPGAEVRGVASAPLLELLEADKVLDRQDVWPSPGAERAALEGRIRAWHPDAAIVLPPSFSSAWFAYRVSATRRLGYAHEGRSVLLTHHPRRPRRGEVHLSDEYLALGRELGVIPGEVPALPVTEAACRAAEDLLGPAPSSGGNLVILGPGAIYGPAKRWSEERFAELGQRAQQRGALVLVCGSAADAPLCERVARAVGGAARSVAGRTNLMTQASLCARSWVTVSNDSGLAHLAASVGAPTVVIFGSTSSAWTAPLGEKVRIVQRAPVCSPCFQRRCSIGYRCLEAVTVAEVDRACRELAA